VIYLSRTPILPPIIFTKVTANACIITTHGAKSINALHTAEHRHSSTIGNMLRRVYILATHSLSCTISILPRKAPTSIFGQPLHLGIIFCWSYFDLRCTAGISCAQLWRFLKLEFDMAPSSVVARLSLRIYILLTVVVDAHIRVSVNAAGDAMIC